MHSDPSPALVPVTAAAAAATIIITCHLFPCAGVAGTQVASSCRLASPFRQMENEITLASYFRPEPVGRTLDLCGLSLPFTGEPEGVSRKKVGIELVIVRVRALEYFRFVVATDQLGTNLCRPQKSIRLCGLQRSDIILSPFSGSDSEQCVADD